MKRKNLNTANSYSGATSALYIDENKSIINVSSEIEKQYNWIDGKRTDEVVGYRAYFAQEGVNPFVFFIFFLF